MDSSLPSFWLIPSMETNWISWPHVTPYWNWAQKPPDETQGTRSQGVGGTLVLEGESQQRLCSQDSFEIFPVLCPPKPRLLHQMCCPVPTLPHFSTLAKNPCTWARLPVSSVCRLCPLSIDAGQEGPLSHWGDSIFVLNSGFWVEVGLEHPCRGWAEHQLCGNQGISWEPPGLALYSSNYSLLDLPLESGLGVGLFSR